MINLSVSPCSNPEMTLEEALAAYAEIGFHRIELFTIWGWRGKSAVDPKEPPETYLALAKKYGFRFSSIHLPLIDDDLEESLRRAVQVCKFGSALGCRVAIVKAKSKENYIAGVKKLLDAINDLPIIPVLTNHAGTAISTLEDYREVLESIDDTRIKCLLEVGHFHSVGVAWSEAYDLLAGRIELVHIKDQVGSQCVPFGTGEIDLPGLFSRLVKDRYKGDIVIEMTVADRENTLDYLRSAIRYVKENIPK